MKTFVNYVEGNKKSSSAVDQLTKSLDAHGWTYELVPGVTPATLDDNEFPWQLLDDGRLHRWSERFPAKFTIKKCCFFNHLRFAQKVLAENEPMIFLEHDVVALGPQPENIDFEDYCFLTMHSAFSPPSILNKKFKKWEKRLKQFVPEDQPVYDFPPDYPLIYQKNNVYNGGMLTPGTSAYVLSPSGAAKLLESAEKNGLEQSDYSYNSNVMRMQAYYPSLFALQKFNPGLSSKL